MRTLLLLALGALINSPAAFAQLPIEGTMPALSGATAWLNSKPLTKKDLRGKVVLIDFWTYSCVNCLRSLPYVKAWNAKYRNQGLVVIGIHAPEFDFEHDPANVKRSLAKLGITYPVALDNDMRVWNVFHNQYWPAHYFVDANGRIRHHHFGEGNYEESERVIRELLAEAHHTIDTPNSDTTSGVSGSGVLAAADTKNMRSPETYVGYRRAERLTSTQQIRYDTVERYKAPHSLQINNWALNGVWRVASEYGVTAARGAAITFRFHARDIDMVLGPAIKGVRVKFHVTIDGYTPGADAGVDVDADGTGIVTEHRLYQLVRQHGSVQDHTVTITFDGANVQAYAFTFG